MQKEIGWLLKEKYSNNLPAGRQGQKNFQKDVKRLEAGEPLDYVIGFTEFLGCKIDLSKKPLIPRPETEYWVEKAIVRVLQNEGAPKRCLDLFSGSGCVGIAVLKKTSVLLCDIADSQDNCLKQAKINCKLNGIDSKRYKIIRSDIFSNIKGKYDYIFANPPYIARTRKNKIQKSVLKFEPSAALFGGKDGFFYIRKFLKNAKEFLNPGGVIFMEFSPEQKKQVQKIILQNKYSNHEFYRDQFGKWRWVNLS